MWGGTQVTNLNKGKIGGFYKCFVDFSMLCLVLSCFSMGVGIGILIKGGHLYEGGTQVDTFYKGK